MVVLNPSESKYTDDYGLLEMEITEDIASDAINNPKSIRHRKKQKFNIIRRQIEFYFGDSNLLKDRFLKKLIDSNPYVPLETFLNFNRMKALTSSIKEIATAIEKSDFLKLSEDRTSVCRTTEIKQKLDVDDYIIYVECLPSTADHDWIQNTFSVFGNISYISLPRYKQTKKIKEFAFIEFEQKASVEKAIAAFREFRGVITAEKNPDELYSIVTYNKEEGEEIQCKTVNNELVNIQNIDQNIELLEGPPLKKQKLNTVVEQVESVEEKKNDNSSGIVLVEDVSENEKSDYGTDIEETENNKKNNTDDDKVETKSRRKRIRKKKLDAMKSCPSSTNDSPQITDLRITSKQTWKRLRNQYLNLQREKIKQMKRSIKLEKSKTENHNTIQTTKITPTRNINFYGALMDKKDDEDDELQVRKYESQEDVLKKKPLFSYQSGIIIKIKLNEPCLELKCFKNEMRQYSQVKYIDIKEGSTEAYLRLDSPSAAENFAKDFSSADHICSILTGKEEELYWNKIKQDREDKLLKRIKTKPKVKFIEKTTKHSTHIRFDDIDE